MARNGPSRSLEAVAIWNVVETQAVHHAIHGLKSLAFSSEAPGPPSEGTLLKHELAGGVNGPVVSFARSAQAFGQLDEALIEGQIVPDRVLPALVGTPEEGEAALKELVDFTEGQPLGGRALDSHNDQGYVGVGGFLRSPDASVSLFGFGGT